MVFGGNLLNPTQLVRNTIEATKDFYMAEQKEKVKEDCPPNTIVPRWKPPKGCIKLIREQLLTSLRKL